MWAHKLRVSQERSQYLQSMRTLGRLHRIDILSCALTPETLLAIVSKQMILVWRWWTLIWKLADTERKATHLCSLCDFWREHNLRATYCFFEKLVVSSESSNCLTIALKLTAGIETMTLLWRLTLIWKLVDNERKVTQFCDFSREHNLQIISAQLLAPEFYFSNPVHLDPATMVQRKVSALLWHSK